MPLLALFVLFEATMPGPNLPTDLGGPDGFGYVFETTQDHGDTISFSWIDPSGHHELTNWYPNADDGCVALALPFRFPFYGDTLDTVVVCTNGFLQFPTNSISRTNLPLPVPALPNIIALFWDDLNPGQSGSVRRFDDLGVGQTVITWLDVVRHNTAETISAQVVLSADGRIQFNFLRVPACATSSTVGIQGHSGVYDQFLQYVCDGVPARHVPVSRTSIRFYVRRLEHDVGVARITSPETWVPAGAQCPVSVVVRNYGNSVESFPVRARFIRTRYPFDTVFTAAVTVNGLAARDSAHLYFGDWLVPLTPDSWYLVFATVLAGDSFHWNDTVRQLTTSVPPRFGTILCSWDFPGLGDGLNLTGVTFCPDSNRFYLNAIEPNRVFSLSANRTGELRLERFELQSFFGDDMLWGVMWDQSRSSFWLGHVPAAGPGTILARYAADGRFTGDTWDLTGVEPGVWFAGLAAGSAGRCYAVAVGGENRIYELDLGTKQAVGYLPGALSSYRACGYVGDHSCFIVTGGWNQNALVRLGASGEVLESAALEGLADIAVFCHTNMPGESLVWGIATTSSDWNTVHVVSLGRTWANVGLGEGIGTVPGNAPRLEVYPNPAREYVTVTLGYAEPGARLDVFDAAGQLVRTEPAAGRSRLLVPLRAQAGPSLVPGVYLVTRRGPAGSRTEKLVVASR
ncbi:MAG: T9SS type A sorting domain-containing protein [candidate division WOR-3 bacterium]